MVAPASDLAESQGETAPGHHGCGECVRLRDQVRRLTLVAQDQAKAIAELTDETPPWAPSLAIVYWQWSDAKRDSHSWKHCFNRIRPLISNLGDLPAQQMSPRHWDQHRAWRKTQLTRFGTPPCDHTLNMELQRAKEMLDFAVERGLMKFNRLTPAKMVKTISQRETKLSADDIERLLEAADDVIDERLCEGDDDGQRSAILRAFILASFDSMLRHNETRHLRRDRMGPGGVVELLATETKSRKRRTIVLTPRTIEAIAKIVPTPGNPYVFVSPETKGLIGENTIRTWFRKAAKISGVDARATPRDRAVRIHDCRSGGATLADANGARPNAIRTAMGHGQISTTEKYLRADEESNAHEIAEVMIEATTGDRRGPRKSPWRIESKKKRAKR